MYVHMNSVYSMCVYTHTHTHHGIPGDHLPQWEPESSKITISYLSSPEAKPYIAFFLHLFRNLEQEHRLHCCFETTMLSGKQRAQERRKQQCRVPQAPPPTRKPCRHQCTPDGVTEVHCHSS